MQMKGYRISDLFEKVHKCGLKNVTIICSKECTMPSDIGGLIYINYKEEKWTEKLRKQLNR